LTLDGPRGSVECPLAHPDKDVAIANVLSDTLLQLRYGGP
jgi:hypothetical protein